MRLKLTTQLRLFALFLFLATIAQSCKKDCEDCVLRIDRVKITDIQQNGAPLPEATYNAREVLIIVDGAIQGRHRYLFMDSAATPFLGFVSVAHYPEDHKCHVFEIGTQPAYDWCPVSAAPQIIIEYYQGRNGLPALSGEFFTATQFRPLEEKSYRDVEFVSGDLTLTVDVDFTDSPYPN